MFVIERIISALAPHECLVCNQEGSLLCGFCADDVFGQMPSRCYKCYKQTKDNLVCVTCKRSSRLKHVWVACEYDGTAKELVRLYKFQRAQAAGKLLAHALHQTIPYLPGSVIVPVPTASSRRRQRGYDHTKIVATQLSSLAKLETANVLVRLGQSRQVGSKRSSRIMQMKNAFRVVNEHQLTSKHVILVDDIVTTGATLEEAAGILKKAGAKSVSAAVFAQSQ